MGKGEGQETDRVEPGDGVGVRGRDRTWLGVSVESGQGQVIGQGQGQDIGLKEGVRESDT